MTTIHERYVKVGIASIYSSKRDLISKLSICISNSVTDDEPIIIISACLIKDSFIFVDLEWLIEAELAAAIEATKSVVTGAGTFTDYTDNESAALPVLTGASDSGLANFNDLSCSSCQGLRFSAASSASWVGPCVITSKSILDIIDVRLDVKHEVRVTIGCCASHSGLVHHDHGIFLININWEEVVLDFTISIDTAVSVVLSNDGTRRRWESRSCRESR